MLSRSDTMMQSGDLRSAIIVNLHLLSQSCKQGRILAGVGEHFVPLGKQSQLQYVGLNGSPAAHEYLQLSEFVAFPSSCRKYARWIPWQSPGSTLKVGRWCSGWCISSLKTVLQRGIEGKNDMTWKARAPAANCSLRQVCWRVRR